MSSTPGGEHDVRTSAFDDEVPLSRLLFHYVRTALITLVIVAVATAYATR